MSTRHVYLKIEPLQNYSPVAPDDAEHHKHRIDCIAGPDFGYTPYRFGTAIYQAAYPKPDGQHAEQSRAGQRQYRTARLLHDFYRNKRWHTLRRTLCEDYVGITVNNMRSPTLDLDSLYGRGPGLDPFLYAFPSSGPSTAIKFQMGTNRNAGPGGPARGSVRDRARDGPTRRGTREAARRPTGLQRSANRPRLVSGRSATGEVVP